MRRIFLPTLAIGLLALIKGGIAKDDEVLQRCLQELRRRTLVDTYSLGNALMALESYYQPSAEMSLLRSGSIDRPQKREVPAEDLALMQKWTDRLMTNVDTRVDPAYLLRFNFDKTTFQATTILTFTIVNIIKLPFYFAIGQFPVSTLSLSLVLLPFAAVGMILGVFLHRMVPQRPFFVLMEGALFVTASKLVWDGSRGLMGLA